ncbi:MAG: hypothetical protein LIP28_06415 [Deltaproteobacteria bacterium]|nr:hypothetical protein [Deltaproteobacteria bacterium]
MRRIRPLLLAVLCLGCLVPACAPRLSPEAAAVPFRGMAEAGGPGVWIFRHKVRLTVPRFGFDQRFDGLMRLDEANRSIRVTALAGLGIRLFDMEMGPDWMRAVYLHPSLKKIPRVTEHVTACIRRIWFDCFGRMPQTITRSGTDSGIGSGADSVTGRVSFSGVALEGVWPSLVRYADPGAGYTLAVRVLSAQREDTP